MKTKTFNLEDIPVSSITYTLNGSQFAINVVGDATEIKSHINNFKLLGVELIYDGKLMSITEASIESKVPINRIKALSRKV